jgi:hypothetical protein
MSGRGRLGFLIACLVLAAGVFGADPATAERRLALVIGNATYENAAPLERPVADAAEVAAALGRLGFEVDLQTDLDGPALQDALRNFGYAAPSADVALFFFSGHGLSVAERSFLLPVDARLRRERDLIYEALPLDLVLDETGQARGLGLVILDASRENPLGERLRSALGPVGAQRVIDGIGRIDEVPGETLVAVSTRPGTTSIDLPGEPSPFVAALLEHLEEPGLELDFLFRKVRDNVLETTRRRQDPRTYDTLGAEPFYFRSQPNRPPVIGEIEPLNVRDDAGPTQLGLPRPSDPDGDEITIEVAGLPDHGLVSRDGQPLSVGDRLPADEVVGLRYEPERNFSGEAGMVDLMIEDAKGAMIGARLRIVVEASNRPPIVLERQELRVSAVPLNLQTPIDPDGDDLTIEITSLPETGMIRDGGRILKVGDELSPISFAGLVLVTEQGAANGVFAFRVTDARGASRESEVDIALATGVSARAAAAPAPVAAAAPAPVSEERPSEEPEPAALATATPPPAPTKVPVVPARPVVPAKTITAGEGGTGSGGTKSAEKLNGETETADEGPAKPAMYRTTRMSNIRKQPRVEAERVATVPPDTLLEVTGQADGQNWYHVKTEDGRSGYIYFALVRPATMNAIKAKLPTVRSIGEIQTSPDK